MKSPVKILIAEHDNHDLELLQYQLTQTGINYICFTARNETEYTLALNNFTPDLILSDYTFPGFSGQEAFRIRQETAFSTPFIFVSGTIGEEKSIELIKTGVTDYVLKDKLFTLGFKVLRALKEAAAQAEKRQIEEKLANSERLLARAQQLSHIGNWEMDFSTEIVNWSDETCRIHGLVPGNNRQSLQSWLSFVHREDIDFVAEKLKPSGNISDGFSIRFRVVRTNGSVRYLHAENKVEFDIAGLSTGLYGTVQDITEKVLLENKLADERRSRQMEITAAVLLAQGKERKDISEELHDNLNQILGAAKIYTELAKTDLENRASLLDKSSACIGNEIEKIRTISKTLAGPGIQVGLLNSIRVLITDSIIASGIRIRLREPNFKEKILNEQLKLTIFRIVQEQVNNILKHSHATSATISLTSLNNEVMLHVKDNGLGHDFSNQAQGVGIQNIRSRAGMHNGHVEIVSKPGKGYELKVSMVLNIELDKEGLRKALLRA